ncbi:MAG: hypothetical protein HY225_00740 [Candidatus Vogelbacteria bacterium]|nr:hypothetical protein [Candidatus Vogelbacteria bacterium]
MKIDPIYLKFPRVFPNDLEGFSIFYPNKFPGVVAYFEDIAPSLAESPEAFRKYGDWARDELWAGFEKIRKDYGLGDKTNLDFLVSVDQRLHKLCCFRFWIVNYIFPDGPLHDFFVDSLKNLIRKFVDVGDDVEEFESKIVKIQRDLLQGDYADLYLQQALAGVEIIKSIQYVSALQEIYLKAEQLIDAHSPENTKLINELWDNFLVVLDSTVPDGTIAKGLAIPREQARFRKTMQPVYNMLTHSVEFRNENEKLLERHEDMKKRIDELKGLAKERLLPEEYDLFVLSYEQARNFTIYKDVMGEIDPEWLPLWFGLLDKVRDILLPNDPSAKERSMGHSGMFYFLVWYLPDHLKGKVMSVDNTPFSLDTL